MKCVSHKTGQFLEKQKMQNIRIKIHMYATPK